jgi:hypothetical protein
MTETIPPDLLHAVRDYPLFDALYGRRSRRFGLGFEMAQGPYKYKSPHAPLPLAEAEEALLVAAGIGFFRDGAVGSKPAYALLIGRRPHLPEHLTRSPHGTILHQRSRGLCHRPQRRLDQQD